MFGVALAGQAWRRRIARLGQKLAIDKVHFFAYTSKYYFEVLNTLPTVSHC